MLDTRPHLLPTDFPALARDRLQTLQVNLGYRCNQQCQHCHVNAGPKRSEQMSAEVIDQVIAVLRAGRAGVLDLTGGAPEMNPHFRRLVREARALGVSVIDRCNLTILSEPDQSGLAEFLAGQQVAVVASLPCYLEENVDGQRGNGVFQRSIDGLRALNALGYGRDAALRLDLVYNPLGAYLPPPQQTLEADYRSHLGDSYGVAFNQLLTLTNMPIARFGSTLLSRGEFTGYIDLLKDSYRIENLPQVMCRGLVSVDWQGRLYDCDFNQMLDMPMRDGQRHMQLADLLKTDLQGRPIRVAQHCYGCTAGQGSSCGGALSD